MKKGIYQGHPLRSEMLEQLKYGCTIGEICKLLGVSYHFVRYHTDKKYRNEQIERCNKKRIYKTYYLENIEEKLIRLIKRLRKVL